MILGLFSILVLMLVFVLLYTLNTYNKLVKYRVEADNSWSQIDVQLKRRYDLIPNLVETVKGVMQFEKDTLTKVMDMRTRAMYAPNMGDRLKAEGEISGLLGRLMAVWENYPDLKSNRNALQLQEELTTTENRISYARGHYNDIVSNLNTMVEQAPSNLVANVFRFEKKEFFQAPATEKETPKVKF